MKWHVDFYVDGQGRAPVEEFLTRLPTGHRAKLLALIKMLEGEGPNLPFPYSSQVKGKLRDLRTRLGKDRLRILYFADANRAFILLHGVEKRSSKLMEEDVQLAERRMVTHARRQERRGK